MLGEMPPLWRHLLLTIQTRGRLMKPTRYTDPNRLGDVMALIQLLAVGRLAIRSEKELNRRLQGKPTSRAATWAELAENHREFFRVVWLDIKPRPPDTKAQEGLRPPDTEPQEGLRPPDTKPREGLRPPDTEPREGNVALIWRDALPFVEGTVVQDRARPALSPESVAKLLEIAVSLHDREITRKQRLAYLVPIAAVIIAGLFSILGLLIPLYFKMPPAAMTPTKKAEESITR